MHVPSGIKKPSISMPPAGKTCGKGTTAFG
jgi:hypothetical protein